jgi:hypothetical protein
MTFILTVLSVDAERTYNARPRSLIVELVPPDNGGSHAGNIAALSNYTGFPTSGRAYSIMVDENGYRSSNSFFTFAHGDDEPAVFAAPKSLRAQLEQVLNDLVSLSPVSQAVVILEDNGHVTDPELTYGERETIERLGPITLSEFWEMVDRQAIREDSLVSIHTR